MANRAVITAKIGPAEAVTALVINNLNSAIFDFVALTVSLNGNIYDIAACTTFTLVLTAGVYVLTIS
jgi:hypothetical protein